MWLAALAFGLPEGKAFWRAHPQLRLLPERAIERDGRLAVVAGFESMMDASRLESVAVREAGGVGRSSADSGSFSRRRAPSRTGTAPITIHFAAFPAFSRPFSRVAANPLDFSASFAILLSVAASTCRQDQEGQ